MNRLENSEEEKFVESLSHKFRTSTNNKQDQFLKGKEYLEEARKIRTSLLEGRKRSIKKRFCTF